MKKRRKATKEEIVAALTKKMKLEKLIRSGKVKIEEISLSQQEIGYMLSRQSAEVTEYLIRLMIFDSPENYNHWRDEVANQLRWVNRNKKNRFPRKDWIYNLINDNWGDMLDSFINAVIRGEENLNTKPYDIKDIQKVFEEYFDWLSGELSEKGEVKNAEIYAKLDELGLPGGNN